MIIVIVIVFYSVLFLVDGYPVIKELKSRKAVAYISIFTAAFFVNILTALKIRIPSPAEGIRKVIELLAGI